MDNAWEDGFDANDITIPLTPAVDGGVAGAFKGDGGEDAGVEGHVAAKEPLDGFEDLGFQLCVQS